MLYLKQHPELRQQVRQYLHTSTIQILFFLALLYTMAGRNGNYRIIYCNSASICNCRKTNVFAEAPGPTEDKFTPRIKNTAAALWKVYAGLTIIEIAFLKINGMSGFEAVCNSLSSISGGGLSPNSQSMIGCSYPLLWITAFSCFLQV